jgi:Lon protease-like protein
MDSWAHRIADHLHVALDALPVFPLTQTVLFPGALLPLHVFEPRYRALIRDCLASNKALAVSLIRDSRARDANGHPAIETVAGLGLIVDHMALPDGRFNVLLCGKARVVLHELPFVPPYRRARATLLEPEPAPLDALDLRALLCSAAAFAADIRASDPDFDFRIPPHATAGTAADLAAHHLVLDARERQGILETSDVATRVRRTTEALALQHAALHERTNGPVN